MSKLEILRKQLFREDGTLVGLGFVTVNPQRGSTYPCITVSLDSTAKRSLTRRINLNNDFYDRYVEAVHLIAAFRGVSTKSAIFDEMLDTVDEFMRRYRLKVKVESFTFQVHHLTVAGQKFTSPIAHRLGERAPKGVKKK